MARWTLVLIDNEKDGKETRINSDAIFFVAQKEGTHETACGLNTHCDGVDMAALIAGVDTLYKQLCRKNPIEAMLGLMASKAEEKKCDDE